MNVVGLDLSLTRTGIDTGDGPPRVLHTALVGMARLAWFRTQVLAAAADADLVVLEGYSFASANQAHQLGELGGVIRLALYDHGAPYVVVPPASLKKWLTGKGNAGKDDMVATAARLGCQANDNNAVDAWALRQMGLYALDRGPSPLSLSACPATAYRDEAVAKVTWPERTAA